jgi:glycosyltransferase involved in cell wall biosynthesis
MKLIIDLRPLLNQGQSGVENYTKNIAKCLQKYTNYECIFWVNSFYKFDFKEFKKLGKCVQTFYPNFIFNLICSIFRYPKIDQIILKKLKLKKKLKTIFFVPDPRTCPVSKNCQKIFTIHDLSFIRYPQFFSYKSRFFHFIVRLKQELKEASLINCVSNFTKQEVLNFFYQYKNKVCVTYEDIDQNLKKLKTSQKPPEIKNKKEKFFLILSTIEKRKNIKTMIKAWQKFNKIYPQIKLVVVGKNNPKIFSSYKIDFNHPKIIHINRYIKNTEKKYLYENALGLFFLSLLEGFGLPLLEAVNFNCPCLYYNKHSAKEIMQNKFFPIKSAENLTEITKNLEKLYKTNKILFKKDYIILKKRYNFKKTTKLLVNNLKNKY